MIRILLSLAAFLTFTTISNAQGIKFQELDWEENIKQAKAKNKLVYIDFYTTWCAPCTFMAKKYFPTKEAGDFYNSNFYCLKIDAEKEGSALAKQYAVNGYPTNLFIDPSNEKIIYKTMGAPSDIKGFIGNGEIAVEEYKDTMSLETYAQIMEKGETTKEFVMKYLNKLTRLDMPNQWPLDNYSSNYFKEKIDKEEFTFMDKYLKGINNNTFDIFKNNKKAYNKYAKKVHPKYGWEEALVSKISYTNNLATKNQDGRLHNYCVQAVQEHLSANDQISSKYYLIREFTYGKDSVQFQRNEYDYANKLATVKDSYYTEKNAEALKSILAQLEWQSKEWPDAQKAKLDSFKTAFSNNKEYSMRETIMAANHLNSQAWHVFENDGDRWPDALKWAEVAYKMAKKSESKTEAAIADTYANLLFVNGNKSEAIKIQNAAIEKLEADEQDTSEYEKTLKKFMGK